ncbi:MAG: cytochrome C oxidase subunit IV family protein [Acidobacteriota bacterium]|nr:cytochrome C oxidase subunit IV family protein [Acidobacteriota bacterium]
MTTKSISELTNYIVGGALLLLTLSTYMLALVDLGIGNLIIALVIAAAKASLIILYFMHARYSDALTRIAIFAALLWFSILLVLTMSDYVSRYPAM